MKIVSSLFINGVLTLLWFYYFQARISDVGIIFLNQISGGGFVRGALHGLCAPDHLASLVPPTISIGYREGIRVGILWGLGHGFASFFLGYIIFQLKDNVGITSLLTSLTNISSFAVGIIMVILGLMGCHDCLSVPLDIIDSCNGNERMKWRNKAEKALEKKSFSSIFLQGFLLGLSWDTIQPIIEVLSFDSISQAVFYLSSHCLGIALISSLIGALVGELSSYFVTKGQHELIRKFTMSSHTACSIVGLLLLLNAILSRAVISFTISSSVIYCLIITGGTPLAILGVVTLTTLQRVLEPKSVVIGDERPHHTHLESNRAGHASPAGASSHSLPRKRVFAKVDPVSPEREHSLKLPPELAME